MNRDYLLISDIDNPMRDSFDTGGVPLRDALTLNLHVGATMRGEYMVTGVWVERVRGLWRCRLDVKRIGPPQ